MVNDVYQLLTIMVNTILTLWSGLSSQCHEVSCSPTATFCSPWRLHLYIR